ncbi:MAG: four helix bundle protein [Marivirga sp.]|nr:four helix bundle protein [Marivirga sp.]
MKTFEDLDCWKKTTLLRRTLSEIVKRFPQDEKYKLVDQIIRASRSVTANIAEGFGRFHYQEYVQYCRQSRGSLYEVIDHLIVACDEGYISKEELSKLKSEIEACLAVLNGFINYLVKAKQSRVNEPEHNYEHFLNEDQQSTTIND